MLGERRFLSDLQSWPKTNTYAANFAHYASGRNERCVNLLYKEGITISAGQ